MYALSGTERRQKMATRDGECARIRHAAQIKPPSKATLRRYGLTPDDWWALIDQCGRRCRLCDRDLATVTRHIDHEHVRGWSQMPPSKRKTFVRGVLCGYDNHRILRKGITLNKALRITAYLEDYENRRRAS